MEGIETMKENECFFCHETTSSLYQFSCNHKICLICLYRRVFCYNITDFSEKEKIVVQCKCKIGEMEKNLEEMNEILQKKSELDKLKEEAAKNPLEFPRCTKHPSNYINHYCVPCSLKVCKRCCSLSESIHNSHRVVPEEKLLKAISNNLKEIPLGFPTKEIFEQNFERIGKQIKEQSEKAYNTTMNQIGDLISQLTLFKKQYDEEYKKELTRGVKTFKLFKLFYLMYYYDKVICEGEEARRKDINMLRFVNNIGYELFGIKITNDKTINQKLIEFKNEAENLRKMAKKSLNISFAFNKVKREFKCDDVLSGHTNYIASIVQANDEKIITGSTDHSIMIWEESEVGNYVNKVTINQMVGKVLCLYLLKDGRLVSTSDGDNTIKIWVADNSKSFTSQQTLTGHNKNVISITQIKDDRLVTGSMDNAIIIWKENQHTHSFELSQRIIETESPVTVVYGMFDNRFASSAGDTKLRIWKETDEFSRNFSCTQVIEGTKKNILTICQILQEGQLITGGDGKSMVRWKEVKDKFQPMQKLTGHEGAISAIIQLYDMRIASASRDRTVRLWEWKNDSFIISEIIRDYEHGIFNLIQLKDGRIAGTSSDKKIILWRNRNDMY